MEHPTVTTICPQCNQNVFSFNQISDSERQWRVRLLCQNAACNFNAAFTITMTPRVFDIFKMEFRPAMDELSDPSHSVSAGYHDASLFLAYFINLLGRVSLDYLTEQIQIHETDLGTYLTLLSEDDLVAFDGRSVQISDQGKALIEKFLLRKKQVPDAFHEKDFEEHQQILVRLLLDGHIEQFNVQRGKIDNVMIDLSQIDLSGRTISQANFRKTSLTRASFENAVLDRCNFTAAALDHSNLKKAHAIDCQMPGADLKSADLSSAVFENSNLAECNMSLINGSHVALRHCILRECNLTKVNFRSADCRRSDFTRSQWPHADLTGANLSGAVFSEANFDDCDLHKTRFDAQTKFLSIENILSARHISRQLWQKIRHQNNRFPEFTEYQVIHEPKKPPTESA
jgi:uncharacterized protein YjbI with pentapeptide repeats